MGEQMGGTMKQETVLEIMARVWKEMPHLPALGDKELKNIDAMLKQRKERS